MTQSRGPASGIRFAAITTHAVQTFSPLYRRLAERSDGFHVLYLGSAQQSATAIYDPGFDMVRQWDVDLLGGYSWSSLGLDPLRAQHPRPADHWRIRRSVGAWLRRERPHAVLLPGWSPAYLSCAYALAETGTPYIVRGTARVPCNYSPVRSLIRDSAKVAVLRRARAVAYIGTAARDEYLRLGVPEERLVSSPYTIDDVWWKERLTAERANRSKIREELGIRADATAFIYVGKLVECKGVDRLLRAYALVPRSPQTVLLIVGDGPLRESLQREAEALGIADRVKFMGFQNQSRLPRVYAAADVAVLFSREESWGLVLNEAVLAGLPLVVSRDVGAARDLVFHGVTGFQVEAGDAVAAAGALEALVQADVREEMMHAIRTLAAHFTIDAAVQGLERAAQIAAGDRRA